MKILFLLKSYSTKIEMIASELKSRGHFVKTVCCNKKSEIKKFLATENPDIIHIVGHRNILHTVRAASGARVVYSCEGKEFAFFAPKCDAKFDIKQILCKRISETENKRSELRSLLKIDDNLTFLALGKAEVSSDLKTFAISASEVLKTHPNFNFVLSEDGNISDSLRALCADLGILDKIAFLPKGTDCSYAVTVADVIVSSSIGENDLTSAAYALGSGLPLILSEGCEKKFTEINGKAGLTFEDGNTEMLVTAMITIAENKSLYYRMRENASVIFEEKYSLEHVVTDLENLYLSLIK